MMKLSNAVKVGILKKAVITAAVLTCVPSSAFADLNSIMAQANSTYSSAMAQGVTSATKRFHREMVGLGPSCYCSGYPTD